jgi:DNA-directed RNA polymerase subunit RPC12/RpoP
MTSDDLQRHLNEHENISPGNGMLPTAVVSTLTIKKCKVILPQKDTTGGGGGGGGVGGNAKMRFKCHICPRAFDRQYSLQRHVALHKGDKRYKCDECQARFSLPFNLNRHKKRVHNSDPRGKHTRCETCGLWFNVNATYRIHLYSHLEKQHRDEDVSSGADDLKCPQCSEEFEEWSDHVAHAASHGMTSLPLDSRPMMLLETSSMTSPGSSLFSLRKPHKCELCYKSFSTEERLTVF